MISWTFQAFQKIYGSGCRRTLFFEINYKFDQIEIIELVVRSERNYCSNCIYNGNIREKREIKLHLKVTIILRNEDPPTTRGLRKLYLEIVCDVE